MIRFFDAGRSSVLGLATRAAKKYLLPPPTQVRHAEYSMVFCSDSPRSSYSERLLDVSLAGIRAAPRQDLSFISRRLRGRFRFPDDVVEVWPGEHYKLLAGLVETLQPSLVVEIGTAEGMSALALKKNLPPQGKLVTFDLIPWANYPNRCLDESDFSDGRLQQQVDDLGDRAAVGRHRGLLEGAELIFVDAAKDGKLERRLIENLQSLEFRRPPIVVFDDTRVWNMLAIWQELRWPKMDLTSFGHWSGTGICELPAKGK
jgi:predicted O-methyltransferase YrrM